MIDDDDYDDDCDDDDDDDDIDDNVVDDENEDVKRTCCALDVIDLTMKVSTCL
jgi:hypothetical protein